MAGEQTAKLYEALTAIAVREAILGTTYQELEIFREVKLPGVSIRNDVLVGPSKNFPQLIFLVTHSARETSWEYKFKRDMAEIVELLLEQAQLEAVFLVLFEDQILPRHLKIAKFALSGIITIPSFDKQKEFRALSHDESVLKSLKNFDDIGKQFELKRLIDNSGNLRAVFSSFVREIGDQITGCHSGRLRSSGFISLTRSSIKERAPNYEARMCRNTRFNRGISKLGLFDPTLWPLLERGEPLKGDFDWATYDVYWTVKGAAKGELLRREGRSVYRCIDPELMSGPIGGFIKNPIILKSIFDSIDLEDIQRIIEYGRQPMTDKYLARIKAKEVFDASQEFIQCSYEALTKNQNLGKLLIEISADPSATLIEYCGEIRGSSDINWNWLYTGLVALFKAHTGKKQGYGYSKIAERMKTPRYKSAVGNTVLKNLEGCLKPLERDLVLETGDSMSSFLEEFGASGWSNLKHDPYRFFLLSEVEDKFLPNAIDVLPAMIELAAKDHGLSVEKTTMTSCLAIASEAGGTAGRTNVYRCENTVIWYKAVHLGHRKDKRKEIQSTVASWMQRWNPDKEVFEPDDDVKKRILVVDGDWNEEDFELLHAFGWDEFLYPDELHRLPELIV